MKNLTKNKFKLFFRDLNLTDLNLDLDILNKI